MYITKIRNNVNYFHCNEKVYIICKENNGIDCCGLFLAEQKESKKHYSRYHRPDIARQCAVDECDQKFTINMPILKHLRQHATNGELGEPLQHSTDTEIKQYYTTKLLKTVSSFDEVLFPSPPLYVRRALQQKPNFDPNKSFDLTSTVVVPFRPILNAMIWFVFNFS